MRITRYAKPARTSSRTAATQRSSSLVPATASALTERDVGRQRPAIGAGGRHRLEDVRDDEDSRRLRQLVTSQAERIAAAVELLVVGGGVVCELAERRHAAEELPRVGRMLVDVDPLPSGQVAGLVEDQVRDAELADVVEQPRVAQAAERLGRQLQQRADSDGDLGDTLGVPGGEGRLGVDHRGECAGDPVERGVVDELDRSAARARTRTRRRPRPRARPELGVALERLQCVDEFGIEPASAALAAPSRKPPRDRSSPRRPPRSARGRGSRAEQRDLGAAAALAAGRGRPSARRASGSRRRSARRSRARGRCRRRARSASRRSPARPVLQPEPDERRGARELRAFRRHVPDRPDQVLREARPVDRLDALLEPEVVAAEELADLGRIRRAARVLEQQRVEERRAGIVVEPEPVGDPHPDQAAPHCMAGRLALGDVERVGQGRDHVRQAKLLRPGAHAQTCAHAQRIGSGHIGLDTRCGSGSTSRTRRTCRSSGR